MTGRDHKADRPSSVFYEPWMKSGDFTTDPSESVQVRAGEPAEIDLLRDSVHSEPVYRRTGMAQARFGEWIARKRSEVTRSQCFVVTVLAAAASGPFAVIGAMMSGRHTVSAAVYAILFGPVTEELLKQAGMLYLVERRPYIVFSRWQLMAGALVSALVFSVLENLIYIHFYMDGFPASQLRIFATFRWRVCTSLHILTGLTASLGMARVWEAVQADAKPADLSLAYPYFLVAVVIHGGYNLIAMLTQTALF